MAEIRLPRGEVCLVDDDDLPSLEGLPWRVSSGGYVVATIHTGWLCHMHRVLIGADPDQDVDHVNGNKLDNRRANLRACAHSENLRNRRRNKNNKAGLKGVYAEGRRGRKTPRWRAEIQIGGRKVRLGSFGSPAAAHEAYRAAALAIHGEFARPD